MHCLMGLVLCLVGATPGWRLERLSSAFANLSYPQSTAYLCDTLLLGTNGYGVICYDVSDAAAPEIFSYLPTPGTATDLKLKDRYCFVADEYAGLAVVDVSQPNAPQEIGHCAVAGSIRDIAVKGDYVFATGVPGDFYVIDVSDPSAPRQIASLPTSGHCEDCEVLGDYAYVADFGASVIRVISIADPAHPVEVNQFHPRAFVVSLYLEDTLLFCGDYEYVRILNVADPMNIREIGSYCRLGRFFPYVTKRDSILFAVGSGAPGLFIVNVADPANPVEIGNYLRPQNIHHVEVKDTFAYLTTDFGLVVLNIADLTNPTEISFLPGGDYVHPAIATPMLYVAGCFSALTIFDVSNPRDPLLLSRTVLPESTFLRGIAYRDSLVYMGTDNGLRVFDVSDPSRPSIIGTLEGISVFEVELGGSYAYVLVSDREMAIIDVSVPTQPRLVSRYSAPGMVYYNLSVSGSFAYIAGHDFEVVDVSDPAQPRQVGFCVTPGDACGVGLRYPYAYVTDYGDGIAVIDIADPTNPQVVNQVPLPGLHAWGCAVADSFLYVRLGMQGLKMFSLADPLNPVEVAYYDTPGGLGFVGDRMAFADDMVFVGDGSTAEILQRRFVGIREGGHEGRNKKSSLSVWPMHGRGRVNISFVVPNKGAVTLNLYSVTGRHQKSFVLNHTGGEHSIVWDGTDERGGNVPAGVYFCQLRAKDYSATKKFVLLR